VTGDDDLLAGGDAIQQLAEAGFGNECRDGSHRVCSWQIID